jgi:hypothetical protein
MWNRDRKERHESGRGKMKRTSRRGDKGGEQEVNMIKACHMHV